MTLNTSIESYLRTKTLSRGTRNEYRSTLRKWEDWGADTPIEKLQALLQKWNAKEGKDETIKVGGKDIKCKVRAGMHKVEGAMVDAKICFSDAVPGGVVLRTRTTRDGDTVIAETTTRLVSFEEAIDKKERGNKSTGGLFPILILVPTRVSVPMP